MKIKDYLNETFVKKQLEPKEGNIYLVKGTTSDDDEVFLKYARFIGKIKKDGKWFYDFRDENENIHYTIRKPFVLGPSNRKK